MRKLFLTTTILFSSLFCLVGCTDDPVVRKDDSPVLGCTEIMYNTGTDSLEFVELKIMSGPSIVDMAALTLRLDGVVDFTFPSQPLDTGEYIVVTNDPVLFKAKYPQFTGRLFGPWDLDEEGVLPKLPAEGDNVEIKLTGKGDVSCSFSGEPPWPSLANGKGRSLVYLGGGLNSTHAEAWAAHAIDGGNPGGPDTYIPTLTVRINEVAPVLEGNASWVEIYNSGTESVDLSGWEFEATAKNLKFTLAEGTVVGPKAYLVLDGTEITGDFGTDGLYVGAFGSDYYLREVVQGVKTGAETSLKASAGLYTSGFMDLVDGSIAQGSLATPTPGAANDKLIAGPVFINEIHYHPVDTENPELRRQEVEFLELINKSEEDISFNPIILGQPGYWKVDGIKMSFVPPASIPANGFALLIEPTADSAFFRQYNNISANVPIYYYQGKLSNRGELLVLKRPYSYVANELYFSFEDAVLYSDDWDGTKEADGLGKSLHRTDYSTMGYESGVWIAAKPTPGR